MRVFVLERVLVEWKDAWSSSESKRSPPLKVRIWDPVSIEHRQPYHYSLPSFVALMNWRFEWKCQRTRSLQLGLSITTTSPHQSIQWCLEINEQKTPWAMHRNAGLPPRMRIASLSLSLLLRCAGRHHPQPQIFRCAPTPFAGRLGTNHLPPLAWAYPCGSSRL